MEGKRDGAQNREANVGEQESAAVAADPSGLNILFLCHRIPFPPDKGDKIRSYHLLSSLAKRGNVDLVTHVDDPRDLRHVQVLRDICRTVDAFPLNPFVGRIRALFALPGKTPLSVAYMTRPSVRRRVRELLLERRYDVVVGYSSQVAAYLPDDLDVPVILDLVDVDSEKWTAYGASRGVWRGFVPRIEGRRVRGLEGRIGERCARVVVTTPREAVVFAQCVGSAEATAIGCGVVMPEVVLPQSQRDGALVVFVGTMDYDPNVEAVERVANDIWPMVRAARPDARFRIVGRSPSARVRALAARDGVEVTGEVPDLTEHLDHAAVALIPLRVARGIQNKVLEALAWGVPVVASTSVGACLHPDAAESVLTEDDDAALARAVVALLDDAALRESHADAGRSFVARHHDWRSTDDAWGRLIESVVVPEAAS